MSNIHELSKLYVEITGRCNLHCRMCMLDTLPSPLGLMPLPVFERLIEQLKDLPHMPQLHFAGYGEPTSHPHFLEMVKLAKAAGAYVGITTNGTLLSAEMCEALITLGLDRLVVSIDGVVPEHYADIRLGGMLPVVIDNMMTLRRLKLRLKGRRENTPRVGIAFVAMRRNFEDMIQLPNLAMKLGASEVIVSNVIPYSAEMEPEILYEHSLTMHSKLASRQIPDISLPKMDITPQSLAQFSSLFQSHVNISFLDASLNARNNYCRFIEDGYSVVRWDGAVSPCLALMHEHDEYIKHRPHHIHAYGLGNIKETPFAQLWTSPEYHDFRERVHAFEFSPCSACARCENFDANQEDCMEVNPSPVCGGCLWARGLVQCP